MSVSGMYRERPSRNPQPLRRVPMPVSPVPLLLPRPENRNQRLHFFREIRHRVGLELSLYHRPKAAPVEVDREVGVDRDRVGEGDLEVAVRAIVTTAPVVAKLGAVAEATHLVKTNPLRPEESKRRKMRNIRKEIPLLLPMDLMTDQV